jgi:hypothetical protein
MVPIMAPRDPFLLPATLTLEVVLTGYIMPEVSPVDLQVAITPVFFLLVFETSTYGKNDQCSGSAS